MGDYNNIVGPKLISLSFGLSDITVITTRFSPSHSLTCKAQFTRRQEASKEWAYKLERPIDIETNLLLKGN